MKFIRVFSILILLAVLFTACQSAPVENEAAPAAEEAAPVEETAPAEEEAPAEEAAPVAEEEAESETLQILGPWLATEADAFEYVLDGFREQTGIEVEYEGSRETPTMAVTRVGAGSPPDIAMLPVSRGLDVLIAQNAVVPLTDLESEITANYSPGWLARYTFDGTIYGIPNRANVQNLLWFNPTTLNGDAPTNWSEFIAYCDTVAADGGACTAGLAVTTFTLSILFESTYAATYGPDQYNAMISREIPLDDPSMVEVINRVATFYSDKYAAGGATGALGTDLVGGISRVFGENADATFLAAGSWVDGIVLGSVNTNAVPYETIDYVPFPGEEAGVGTIVTGADAAVILVDSPEARAFISYLMSDEAAARFAENGYPVANLNVDPALFDGLASKSAELLITSTVVESSQSALGDEISNALVEVIGAGILDPTTIEPLLANLEATYGK